MAHGNCESMRSRAFTKGRSAFDSDDEYRRALNGEFDEVREDFSYEANEDPDDGEEVLQARKVFIDHNGITAFGFHYYKATLEIDNSNIIAVDERGL